MLHHSKPQPRIFVSYEIGILDRRVQRKVAFLLLLFVGSAFSIVHVGFLFLAHLCAGAIGFRVFIGKGAFKRKEWSLPKTAALTVCLFFGFAFLAVMFEFEPKINRKGA